MRVLAVATALPHGPSDVVGIFIQREIDALRRLGMDVVTFEARYRLGPVRAARALRRRIHESRPDLVHVYAGSIGALCASFVSPVPLVVTFMGSDLLGAARGDPLRERFVCHVSVLCSQWAARRAAALVVWSEQLRGALRRRADRARARVIPGGVDVDLFRPMDRGLARRSLGWEEGPVVLFGASRHRAVKRFWLAEAAIRRLAALGIAARLESLEDVPPARVPLYLNAADCMLLTSQHEGSPNVVKEAVACACPVVGVPVGDVREILEGVAPGAVVEADETALAAALLAVLRDGRRADGVARIRDRHSAAAVAERVRGVYLEALSRSTATRPAPA